MPNAEFFPHARLILQIIAVNLGLPIHVLLLDPSETNFTGWRGAMDLAKLGFRCIQGELVRGYLRPVYLWKLRQWIAEDPALRRAAARGDIRIAQHVWTPPAWPYIEPLKDASTDLLRLRNRLTSPRRVQAERGADWDVVSTEIVQDTELAIEKAILAADRLNGKFPHAGVRWREVLSMPTPEGVDAGATSFDQKTRVDAVAALVRAGFVAEDAAHLVGIGQLAHHGVLPITLQSIDVVEEEAKASSEKDSGREDDDEDDDEDRESEDGDDDADE